MDYKSKYLKYKNKYFRTKGQNGGVKNMTGGGLSFVYPDERTELYFIYIIEDGADWTHFFSAKTLMDASAVMSWKALYAKQENKTIGVKLVSLTRQIKLIKLHAQFTSKDLDIILQNLMFYVHARSEFLAESKRNLVFMACTMENNGNYSTKTKLCILSSLEEFIKIRTASKIPIAKNEKLFIQGLEQIQGCDGWYDPKTTEPLGVRGNEYMLCNPESILTTAKTMSLIEFFKNEQIHLGLMLTKLSPILANYRLSVAEILEKVNEGHEPTGILLSSTLVNYLKIKLKEKLKEKLI